MDAYKKTPEKVTLGSQTRIVYINKNGTKFIKQKGEYVLLSKIRKSYEKGKKLIKGGNSSDSLQFNINIRYQIYDAHFTDYSTLTGNLDLMYENDINTNTHKFTNIKLTITSPKVTNIAPLRLEDYVLTTWKEETYHARNLLETNKINICNYIYTIAGANTSIGHPMPGDCIYSFEIIVLK